MYKYTHEEDGMYYLIDAERGDILWSGPQVAVGFSYDPEDGSTLHKHGSPDHVNAWATKTRAGFMEASRDFKLIKDLDRSGIPVASALYEEMANQITVIEGVFPIAELMKCIEIAGYIGIFYKKLQEGKVCCGNAGLIA